VPYATLVALWSEPIKVLSVIGQKISAPASLILTVNIQAVYILPTNESSKITGIATIAVL